MDLIRHVILWLNMTVQSKQHLGIKLSQPLIPELPTPIPGPTIPGSIYSVVFHTVDLSSPCPE